MAHPAEPFAGDLYPQRAGAGGPPQSHWLIQPQLPLCHFHMVPSSVDRNCCKPSRAMAEWPWRWGQRSVHTPGTARSLILQAVATATHPACPRESTGHDRDRSVPTGVYTCLPCPRPCQAQPVPVTFRRMELLHSHHSGEGEPRSFSFSRFCNWQRGDPLPHLSQLEILLIVKVTHAYNKAL